MLPPHAILFCKEIGVGRNHVEQVAGTGTSRRPTSCHEGAYMLVCILDGPQEMRLATEVEHAIQPRAVCTSKTHMIGSHLQADNIIQIGQHLRQHLNVKSMYVLVDHEERSRCPKLGDPNQHQPHQMGTATCTLTNL